MEAFQNPHPTMEGPGYQDFSFLEAHGNYEPKFEMVTGDQRIAQGVTLLEMPGHTAGHYSLWLRLQDGVQCCSLATLAIVSRRWIP